MKRLLKTATAAAAALALLAGCSGTGSSSETTGANGPTKLNMWVPPLAANNEDKALWDEIVAPFEKENNVDVNITVIPWDAYETKYLTGISSNDGPDVGYMYSEMIGDYIAKNQLVDMTDKVTKEQKDNFYFLKNGEFAGKQYSIPLIVGGARVLFYNKDLLAKAGVDVPKTWDEFLAAGVKLKEAGIKPYTAAWGDPARGAMNHVFFPYLFQAGGKLFADDGSKTLFDSPEMLEAAKFIVKLREKGFWTKQPPEPPPKPSVRTSKRARRHSSSPRTKTCKNGPRQVSTGARFRRSKAKPKARSSPPTR
ncbi:ABC transporter substrate-binding protein [Trueperella pyogenes]|uniref:ABC transporter substrate-binding protein n=1 Tax=Trueperella pyogenes TaxID=1661 RepID=UPI003873C60F